MLTSLGVGIEQYQVNLFFLLKLLEYMLPNDIREQDRLGNSLSAQ
jgi:hypothetical protein